MIFFSYFSMKTNILYSFKWFDKVTVSNEYPKGWIKKNVNTFRHKKSALFIMKKYLYNFDPFYPCPAEPGYTLPLQTV